MASSGSDFNFSFYFREHFTEMRLTRFTKGLRAFGATKSDAHRDIPSPWHHENSGFEISKSATPIVCTDFISTPESATTARRKGC